LIDAAREAFIQGLNLTAAISGVGAIALAVFIAVLLRRMRVGSGPEGDADLEQEPAIV
jgi:hypothetical protein